MLKMGKTMVLAAIIALALALPLSAQLNSNSNTSSATAGMFGNDVDDYMDYHYWSDVSFDKWFGFAGWNVPIMSGSSVPSLGYATNFAGLYLAAWFNGNIMSVGSGSKTETTSTAPGVSTSYTTYSSNSSRITASNHLSVLVGMQNMGIKVGFLQEISRNKLKGPSGTQFGTQDLGGGVRQHIEVVEYAYRDNYFTPYVGWGGVFGVLKPYATLGLTFVNDRSFNTYTEYQTENGQRGGETIRNNSGYKRNYVSPGLVLGVKYDLDDILPLPSVVGIQYDVNFRINSNNDYSASGIDGKAKGEVSWGPATTVITRPTGSTTTTVNTRTIDVNEKSEWNHTFTPSITMSEEIASGLKLGLGAELPIAITAQKDDEYTDTLYRYVVTGTGATTNETYTHTPNGLTKTTTFGVGLTLAVGATYQLVPNRFSINAGIEGTPLGFSNTTTKTSDNGAATGYSITGGTRTNDTTPQYMPDTKATNFQWSSFSYTASGGFTFYYNPKAAIDMAITSSGGNGNLSLTDVNVLLILNF